MNESPLFPPFISQWFQEKFSTPTEVQRLGWKAIAGGDDVLMTAPTGSGKTLAAFLWAIKEVLTGRWESGGIRILYISPLKALNKDLQVNLLSPLAELQQRGQREGIPLSPCRVSLRSGDTPPYQREKQLRKPSEIFITTPESLHLLLSSTRGRQMLQGIKTVILDEIHALCANKRGSLLSLNLERLARLNGQFQRIGLSATVNPLTEVGRFLTGNQGKAPLIIQPESHKEYSLQVKQPSGWQGLGDRLYDDILQNRSTLIFTTARRTAERVCRMINESAGNTIAYAHHGSLSRELRQELEENMKGGKLKAIVATNSLELGIDVGSIDMVILVGTPYSFSGALQKLGRAGHQVGAVSHGKIYPLHGFEYFSALVMARCLKNQDLEVLKIPRNPLDIIPQVIIGELCQGPSTGEEMFRLIQGAYPYKDLERKHLDLVLQMMAGEYKDSRIAQLKPKIDWNREEDTLTLRHGVITQLYLSGGTIPDRGYYKLRNQQNQVIGELDEEFVWERRQGDTFYFGNQNWKIEKIDHQSVFARSLKGRSSMTPFWRAEKPSWDPLYCQRLGEALEEAQNLLEDKNAFGQWCRSVIPQEEGQSQLFHWLRAQNRIAGLPGSHRILWEICPVPEHPGHHQAFLYNLWGNRVNEPLSMAIKEVLQRDYRYTGEVLFDNSGIFLPQVEPEWLTNLLYRIPPEQVLATIKAQGGISGLFGGIFRDAASRSLIIQKKGFNHRHPLWLARKKAKEILANLEGYEDFPLILETWREYLQDRLDLGLLKDKLEALQGGVIEQNIRTTGKPSPFSESINWQYVNQMIYAPDAPETPKGTALSEDLWTTLEESGNLPGFSQETLEEFAARFTHPGREDLLYFLKDRLVLPREEWESLTEGEEEPNSKDLFFFTRGKWDLVCHRDNKNLLDQWSREDRALFLLQRWFQFSGPILKTDAIRFPGGLFDKPEELLQILEDQEILRTLKDHQGASYIIHQDRLEHLLRFQRQARRVQQKGYPLSYLPEYIRQVQGIRQGDWPLEDHLDPLLGLPLPMSQWEEEVLPARRKEYQPFELEGLLGSSPLLWMGAGREKVLFTLETEESYFSRTGAPPFLPGEGSWDFWQLQNRSGLKTQDLTETLWDHLWKGQILLNSITPLRQKILMGKKSKETEPRRLNRRSWESSRPLEGYWRRSITLPGSPTETRERLRFLLTQAMNRFGILSPPLIDKTPLLPAKSQVFHELRMMEWSGQILQGEFFQGLPHPQYLPAERLSQWLRFTPEDHYFWLHAQDPASLCGLELSQLKEKLPPRRGNIYLFYRGCQFLGYCTKGGSKLWLYPEGEEALEGLPFILSFFQQKLTQPFRPWKKVKILEINGQPPRKTPFYEPLTALGMEGDYKYLYLH